MTATGQVTLVVIAKDPVPGRVKTRLCPPCSPQQAADIARAALLDTLDAVGAARAGRRVLAFDGARPDWLPATFEVVAQRGNGLDERLAAVFDDADGPTLVLGMDTPQVTPALLDDTCVALRCPGVDAVVGPAEDGGYWSIGLARPDPAAVRGVPMSRSSTFDAQCRRLQQLGLHTVRAQSLRDVDDVADARAVASEVPGSRFAAAVERTT